MAVRVWVLTGFEVAVVVLGLFVGVLVELLVEALFEVAVEGFEVLVGVFHAAGLEFAFDRVVVDYYFVDEVVFLFGFGFFQFVV